MTGEQPDKYSIQAIVIIGILTILIPIHLMYANGLTFSFYDEFLNWLLGPNNKQLSAFYSLTFMIYVKGVIHLKDNQKFVNVSLVLGALWSFMILICSFIFDSSLTSELRISAMILLGVALTLWLLDSTSIKKYGRPCKLILLSNLGEATKFDLIHRTTIFGVVITWII